MANMSTCIYCGRNELTVCKSVSVTEICKILEKQKLQGINDAVTRTTTNLIEQVKEMFGAVADNEQPLVMNACTCCYHWMSRRVHKSTPPLPMQVFLWYLNNLKSCEDKECDQRILLRMAKSIVQPNNPFCFLIDTEQHKALCDMLLQVNDDEFKVKRKLAEVFWKNNNRSMFVTQASSAQLLRDKV